MDRVIVDTDTAGDDTQALALACLTDRLSVEAVTVVTGNVPFDREVENAKYTLSLVGSDDVPVFEGARSPLLKEYEHAEEVHGAGGLGGDLHPETEIDSAPGFGPDVIAERCRESPGEISLLCIGPLTNLALAHAREPDLPDLVDEVWVMGGNVNCAGNVTPAAEFNFWVDPDAAHRALAEFDVTLVDWGLCQRNRLGADLFDAVESLDTDLAEFFLEVNKQARAFGDDDSVALPDGLTTALAAYPQLREELATYHVAVDEREGLTRGYTSVDVRGLTDGAERTRVVESADDEGFETVLLGMLRDGDPDGAIPSP
ncbi:nucleoside hydrolase [Halobacteriales archaeon SW_12_69_24]|nr:MAG: nucleoside hydrolase [Halobacteriales archaeon SW_12_69_24]